MKSISSPACRIFVCLLLASVVSTGCNNSVSPAPTGAPIKANDTGKDAADRRLNDPSFNPAYKEEMKKHMQQSGGNQQ